MVRRAVAALVTALLVAACGSGSHSTSKSSSSTSSTAAATTGSSPASSTTSSQSSSTSTSASSSSTTAAKTKSTGHHAHTQPPVSTPHFLVKLTIGSGGSLKPPSVAIGGHTLVDLSVSNRSGSSAKLEIAHGSQAVLTKTLPTGQTAAKLPALKNATYTLLIDGKPRGTLTIGAKAGP
jgi:hypothetical protein